MVQLRLCGQLPISRVIVHVVFGQISTSPVTALIRTYTENGPSKEPLRQSDAGVSRAMNHKMKEAPPNIPTVEPITSSRFC
jgi:hypothetical protein